MSFEEDFDVYVRARFTLLWVVSYEEERIITEITSYCTKTKRRLISWDIAAGFKPLCNADGNLPPAPDPKTALEAIAKAGIDREAVFILKDFHACLERQPVITRQLRNLAHDLKPTKKTIVITSPKSLYPDELKDDVFVVDFAPPEQKDLQALLEQIVRNSKTPIRDLTVKNPATRDKVVQAGLGLTSNQAQRVFAKAIVSEIRNSVGDVVKDLNTLNDQSIELITREKKSIIRESGALEFFSPQETIADVGGLELLKEWLTKREKAFGAKARAYGLPAPKGIALIGIPGTGKSLTAKMVSGLWKLPLIRLDVGALFGGLVGQSEENTRRALDLVEAVSPCVLWIDEMEKAFGTGGHDGGTSSRVFGNVLTWLQERTHPVFVIGTANDVTKLPPETLRAGRFDATFFLDLPTRAERHAIFEVHILKRKRMVQNYDLDRLAGASEGYVGAEIEQAIIDAMYIAYNDPKEPERDFTTDDILVAMERLVKQIDSQHENIKALQTWLQEKRAQPSSIAEARESRAGFLQL